VTSCRSAPANRALYRRWRRPLEGPGFAQAPRRTASSTSSGDGCAQRLARDRRHRGRAGALLASARGRGPRGAASRGPAGPGS
jgi:hypothetical protein